MSEENKKIDLGGHTVRTRTLGAGDRTFVLLHGFADGMDVWNAVAADLAARGRVVLVEQRGHGYTAGPAGPYEWDDLGRELVSVLAELGVARAVLVGHGLGGIVALLTALEAPERVEKLVLIGTATEADAEQETWCREIRKAGKWNAMQGISHAIFGPTSRKQVDGIPGPLVELAKRMETLSAEPITSRMTAVSCPALVLRGENDPARSESLAQALPGATAETLAGHGHFPHKKDPAAVAAAILKFAGS